MPAPSRCPGPVTPSSLLTAENENVALEQSGNATFPSHPGQGSGALLRRGKKRAMLPIATASVCSMRSYLDARYPD